MALLIGYLFISIIVVVIVMSEHLKLLCFKFYTCHLLLQLDPLYERPAALKNT